MRAREFILHEAAAPKQLGRAFNHLEDLVFFYGAAGTMEALQHIKDFADSQGSGSIRMKWDGNPQIYWGRETKGGPLILGGHNSWSRGAKTSSPDEIKDFIVNKSGSPKTPEEVKARQQFADQFANLYPLFDQGTPKDFVGFVYADGLFLSRPELDAEGVYNFCPNPKSKTCYHVRKDSELGKRIAGADVMVVGHAFFPEWGMPDTAQKPISDFTKFNANSKLIVLGPIYNTKPVKVDTNAVEQVEAYLGQVSKQIDGFLTPQAGLSDLKDIFYRYVNQRAKAKQLDSVSGKDFSAWLTNDPKVSDNKRNKIFELSKQYNGAVDGIFKLVRMIQDMKDNIIDQIEGEQGDIWDTEGEGRVRYADKGKQFGNVKLVPRKRWTPQ
jgi:hypothetical protein